MSAYFTLVVCEKRGESFQPEFGSHKKAEVIAELQDWRDHGYKVWQLWILGSGQDQPSIDAAVAAFNAGYKHR